MVSRAKDYGVFNVEGSGLMFWVPSGQSLEPKP